MDQELVVRAVNAATQEVFSTMLGLEVRPGQPYNEAMPNVSEGVVALLGLAGRWSGTGMLSCPPALAARLAAQLLMSEPASPDAVNEEVLDAVAEIANMVIGNVKNVLEEELGPMGMSIPTVIYGRNFTTRGAGQGPWIVTPFECDAGRLEVRVYLAPSREAVPIRHGFRASDCVAL